MIHSLDYSILPACLCQVAKGLYGSLWGYFDNQATSYLIWTLENHQELLFKTLMLALYYELQAILGCPWSLSKQIADTIRFYFVWVGTMLHMRRILLLCEHGRCQLEFDYQCNANDDVTLWVTMERLCLRHCIYRCIVSRVTSCALAQKQCSVGNDDFHRTHTALIVLVNEHMQ